VPPCWRAKSQLNSAVRALPTWKKPVGDGPCGREQHSFTTKLALVSGGPAGLRLGPYFLRRCRSSRERSAGEEVVGVAACECRRSLVRASRSMRRTRSAVR
jgi:hypothetical protein